MGIFAGGKCYSKARLDGKTAIITGANCGIGLETAKDFYERGARVIAACRSLDKANAAVASIKKRTSQKENLGELTVMALDLSSLESVRKFADAVLENEEQINILVNNAGVMMCPKSATQDGFEMQFGTNHLGHFLLTLLLLPKICRSVPARIVTVSSTGHAWGTIVLDDLNWENRKYEAMGAYGQSKLANVLFTKELARRLVDENINDVTAYSLHPGVVRTELDRHMDSTYFSGITTMMHAFCSVFMKTPAQGAQTSIYCAVDEKCATESGLYYSDCKPVSTSKEGNNMEIAGKLWEKSLELVGLPIDYDPFQQQTH